MPIISVSGHSRKVGKTSIAAGLIAALPEYDWTALKVSSHRHAGDPDTDYTVIEETNRDGGNDTARFLKAGARRAFWIQAGCIEAAIPAVRAIIETASFVVIEGNSVLDYIAADYSILVLNCGVAEFKESARVILSRADALVLIGETAAAPEWKNLLKSAPEKTLRFETSDPNIFPPGLTRIFHGISTAGAQ